MNMKKRSQMQGGGSGSYNGQHKRNRFSQGGGSGGGGHHQHNRPRKNYSALREKYLAQARDALASGDRVLAENYLQHADHCYRMMMEEGQNRPRPQQSTAQPGDEANAQPQQQDESAIPQNTTALPAFLTANYEAPEPGNGNVAVATPQWEE